MDAVSASLPMPPAPGVSAFIPPAPSAYNSPQSPSAPSQAAPQSRAVGRPSSDPVVQDQREERHQLRQRLKNILPKSMTDGRIAVYRLEGRKGRTRVGNRPVLTILFQDLEKAQSEGIYADTGELVEDRLIEKYGHKGRFLWEAQDNRGRALPEAGETEIDLSDGADDPDEENEVHDDDDTTQRLEDLERQAQGASHIPPPPPPLDLAAHARQVKEIVQEEKRGAENMVTVLMTMMQQQNQQNVQAMQLQMQQAEQRRQEEERRREREESKEREERKMDLERMRLDQERREKEEQRREEREKDRRQAEMQMQMQFFQAVMNRPDTTTPMLMKMIENKGDRDGAKELFGLMGEASRQSMAAQGEATKHLLGAQAEAAKAMMANVMGMSQTMVQQLIESQAEPTDDPMEKVARVFKMIAPALGALSPAGQPAQLPPPPRVVQAQVQPAQRQQQSVPPAEWIKGGLYTIMKLETGEIPIQQRFNALKWCADNLPRPMLDAIRSGVEDNVLSIGAQGMDNTLMGWISEEVHAQFLRDCISDIQRLLLGAMTQSDAKASIEKHATYMRAKAGGGPPPAAESIIPADFKDSDVAQPVTEKVNGKRKAPPLPAEVAKVEEPPAGAAPEKT